MRRRRTLRCTGSPTDVARWNAVVARHRRLVRRRGLCARMCLWYDEVPYYKQKRITVISWAILIFEFFVLLFAPG